MQLLGITVFAVWQKAPRMDCSRNSLLGCFGFVAWVRISSFSNKLVRQESFANAAGQGCTVTPIKIRLTRWEIHKFTRMWVNLTADQYAKLKVK
jgi:hypothetical protein